MKLTIKDSVCIFSLNKANEDDPRIILDISPPIDDWRPIETITETDAEGNTTILPSVAHTVAEINVSAIGDPVEIARRIEIELFGYDQPDVDLTDTVNSILTEPQGK